MSSQDSNKDGPVEEEVGFRNGPVTLGGTLILPPSPGPHPAMVYYHGRMGPSRDSFLPFAEQLVSSGVAVLTYDRRGYRDSSGDMLQSDLGDLADDGLAGVELLRGREEIDSAQIGLWGRSLGGLVAPIAASRHSDIGFVVLESAPATAMRRQVLFAERNVLAARGASSTKKGAYMWARRTMFGVSGALFRGKRNWWLRNAPWPPPAKGLVRRSAAFALYMDHDPSPPLEAVTCPVLALFGELDDEVPVEESVAAMESAFERGGNGDFTITVVPKANHLGHVEGQGDGTNPFPGLAIEWLLKRVSVADGGRGATDKSQ